MSLPGNPRGMRGFFAWLHATQPGIHRAVMVKLRKPATLGALGLTAPDDVTQSDQAAAPSTVDNIKNIVLGVSQAYLTAQQVQAQKKVLDMQLQRAQAGLPPLDINLEQYGLTGPSVSVGLSQSTKQLLTYGGAALAAVYLLPKLFKR